MHQQPRWGPCTETWGLGKPLAKRSSGSQADLVSKRPYVLIIKVKQWGSNTTSLMGRCGRNRRGRARLEQSQRAVAMPRQQPQHRAGETQENYQGLGGCDELGLEKWLQPFGNVGSKSCEAGCNRQCGWSPFWVPWQNLPVSGCHGHTRPLAHGFGSGCRKSLVGREGFGGHQDRSVQKLAGRPENSTFFFPSSGFFTWC